MYLKTRQFEPARNREVVTCYETDEDLLVLRHVVDAGEGPRLFEHHPPPGFRLQPGPALEPCSAREFLALWQLGCLESAQSALPDLPEEPLRG